MAQNFAEIAFTDSVKAAQQQYGSRRQQARQEARGSGEMQLTNDEADFINERDGFYMATVSETGWPYVQFRGGPKGFLKVLDAQTLGFADFRGNTQYLSVGNLRHNGRVALILMDYANRVRLKVWAQMTVIDAADDPALIERLHMPNYPARIERAMLLKVEAFDWNCQQHITPRFTEEEIAPLVAQFTTRIQELEAEIAALKR
jgi:predicted pyridoxine 5'-phosphate oxidase superfamily flavin-nucleotide-binding protein